MQFFLSEDPYNAEAETIELDPIGSIEGECERVSLTEPLQHIKFSYDDEDIAVEY